MLQDEVRRTSGKRGKEKIHIVCWWENLMRKDHLGYLGLDVAIFDVCLSVHRCIRVEKTNK